MDGVAIILSAVAFLVVWCVAAIPAYLVTIILTNLLHARGLNSLLVPLVRLAIAIWTAVLVYRHRVPSAAPPMASPQKRSSDEGFAAISAIGVFLMVWWTTALGFYLLAYLPALQQHPGFQLTLMLPAGFIVGLGAGAFAGVSAYRRISKPSVAPRALPPTRSPIVNGLRYLDRKIGLGTISVWLCLLQIPWAVANVMLLMLLAPHSDTPGIKPLDDEGFSILSVYYLAPAVLGIITGILADACSSFRGQKLLGVLAILGSSACIWAFLELIHSH
jgi:hypothetical protein